MYHQVLDFYKLHHYVKYHDFFNATIYVLNEEMEQRLEYILDNNIVNENAIFFQTEATIFDQIIVNNPIKMISYEELQPLNVYYFRLRDHLYLVKKVNTKLNNSLADIYENKGGYHQNQKFTFVETTQLQG